MLERTLTQPSPVKTWTFKIFLETNRIFESQKLLMVQDFDITHIQNRDVQQRTLSYPHHR
jgi:hypothetical protein